MGPENGINLDKISYFPMEDYINNITLENYLLEHLEETGKNFDKYLKKLASYGNYPMIYYWIDSLAKEMKYSQIMENSHIILPCEIEEHGIFFDTLQMSHSRIKKLHQFVTKSNEPTDYRKDEVRVSRMTQHETEEIYWYGVQPEDLKQFLDDFIKIYKQSGLSLLSSNPFLKSALMHLLFVRIHPFNDGNGRTARMIHNIKFTESINKIYGMNLKICPLNLSQSILLNQITYAKRINNIYFDLEHNCNNEINLWFNFILDMVDEQINYSENRISGLENSLINIEKMQETDTSDISKAIKKMKIKI